MALQPWAEALALRFQEQATSMSHDDIRKGLEDCLNDDFPDQYPHVCDVFGDDESGDVVYHLNGDYKRAPYSMGMANGKRAHNIDHEQAEDVLPRTVYDAEADDDDHMSSMGEADRAKKLIERFPGSKNWKHRPISERFISKSERDNADSGDFAGEGKSFPILKPGDVMAAVHSIGRGVAGGQSAQKLKNRIKAIAKRKGWSKSLPKAWQDEGDGKEAAAIEITGDVIPLREGAVGQDGSAMLKLIAPGWGSSGYYSSDLLKRDGPKAFPAGTKNFWNHQTAAEEAARPEGDLRDLASVLTEDARWEDSGPAGPGLYARAVVQPHFREHVDSLAKHIGMSIRASGRAKEGKVDGKTGPIIEQLTKGHSVDYVTTPGAGGKILQLFEAARGRNSNEGEDMDEATVKRLISEATAPLIAENNRLKEAIGQADAPKVKRGKTIKRLLEGIRFSSDPEKDRLYKESIVERVKADYPLTEAGVTDDAKLKERVEKEVKRVAAKLPSGRVVNFGSPAVADAKIAEAADKQHADAFAESMNGIADIFLDVTSETDEKEVEHRRKMFAKGRAA